MVCDRRPTVAGAYFRCCCCGCCGLHHFYLGRFENEFAWSATGGVFGLGLLYDAFCIPSWVTEAQDETQAPHEGSVMEAVAGGLGRIVLSFFTAVFFADVCALWLLDDASSLSEAGLGSVGKVAVGIAAGLGAYLAAAGLRWAPDVSSTVVGGITGILGAKWVPAWGMKLVGSLLREFSLEDSARLRYEALGAIVAAGAVATTYVPRLQRYPREVGAKTIGARACGVGWFTLHGLLKAILVLVVSAAYLQHIPIEISSAEGQFIDGATPIPGSEYEDGQPQMYRVTLRAIFKHVISTEFPKDYHGGFSSWIGQAAKRASLGPRGEHLATLGFQPWDSPSDDEIRDAYKKKLVETHPDKGGTAEAFYAVEQAGEFFGAKRRRRRPASHSSTSTHDDEL